MKGSIGTAMMFPGERSRVMRKGRISNLIWAKDILKCRDKVDKGAIEICEWALEYPLGLTHRQARTIYAVWMNLAKAGHLRGIRTNKSPNDQAH